LRNAKPGGIETLNLVLSRSLIGKMRLMNEEPRLIRTSDLAIGTADAEIIVDRHDAIRPLARCRCRADVHARWIGAVLTSDRNEYATDIWISAGLDVENLAPLHCR
jgi:hypothetical protein